MNTNQHKSISVDERLLVFQDLRHCVVWMTNAWYTTIQKRAERHSPRHGDASRTRMQASNGGGER
ncbi:hypothetical protein [Stieleria bergensis]